MTTADLIGLEYRTGLYYLYFCPAYVGDISPVADLANVIALYLGLTE